MNLFSKAFIIIGMLGCFSLSGCFQAYSPDDDLRTVPVTNNPHVVPNHGSGMMPGSIR